MTQTKKKEGLPPILVILCTLAFIFGIFKLISFFYQPLPPKAGEIASRISSGEESLMPIQATPEKQSGIKAFANSDYASALKYFEASLQQQRNDPEALIYLNNTKARINNPAVWQIGVSVPIGSNLDVAQEILRGVAQAQDEINGHNGINGVKIVVTIANDANDPELAKQIATTFVNNDKILGVVGHNTSNASLAAAPIYQAGGLVMISPTSFAANLSGFGSYIFRTVPTTKAMATRLVEYMVKTNQKSDIVVCYDSQASDNISFKDELVASLLAQGGRIVPLICDFAAPTFNNNNIIQQALSRHAKGLVLSPHVDRIRAAIQLARENHNRIPLFSSPTLYTLQTLKDGQADMNGLVLPATWHPQAYANNRFSQDARRQWGGEVSWRTAMSYDATQALVAGIERSQTRLGVQQALRSNDFSTVGADETVRFEPATGDRQLSIQLIQVQASKPSRSGTGFDFVPLNFSSH